jgi:metal-responsive CopG/Arc/MetJ family transcriptional regulator
MDTLDPNTCTISICLSENEYKEIQEFCTQNGFPSIDDMVDKAIRYYLTQERPNKTLCTLSLSPDQQMKNLENVVEKFSKQLALLIAKKLYRRSKREEQEDVNTDTTL